MGCRILYDRRENVACFLCSTSGVVFGHVFRGDDADDQAETFLAWLGEDPRSLSEGTLKEAQEEFWRTHLDASGNLREEPIDDEDSREFLAQVRAEAANTLRRVRGAKGGEFFTRAGR